MNLSRDTILQRRELTYNIWVTEICDTCLAVMDERDRLLTELAECTLERDALRRAVEQDTCRCDSDYPQWVCKRCFTQAIGRVIGGAK